VEPSFSEADPYSRSSYRSTSQKHRSRLPRLASVLAFAVVLTISMGAFYVAFAQSYSTGTYLDSSCASGSASAFTGQDIYVLFELPGPGEGVGYLVTGSTTLSTVSLDSISSTCVPFYYGPGTYTAYLLSSTGSSTSTSSALFTEFSPFTVAAYPDPSCAGSQASLFTSGGNVYIVIAGPGSLGPPWYGFVESGTTTYLAFGPNTDPSSTSTCLTLSMASAGTYTGLVASVGGSGTAQFTSTPLSTNFTVNSAVPDLPLGVLPLVVILPLVYLFFLLRSKAKPGENAGLQGGQGSKS
jgi:hypothetical protein